jgi:hypothetical protein
MHTPQKERNFSQHFARHLSGLKSLDFWWELVVLDYNIVTRQRKQKYECRRRIGGEHLAFYYRGPGAAKFPASYGFGGVLFACA